MFSLREAVDAWLYRSEAVDPARAHLETFCSLNSGRQGRTVDEGLLSSQLGGLLTRELPGVLLVFH